MKFRKVIALLFVVLFVSLFAACGEKEESKVDPTVPTAIALKVKTAKVQIGKTINLTYTITPATAQANDVTVTVNNKLATVAKAGDNKTVKLTAGSEEGTVKVTITTTNGITASKTIKIQIEEVASYPDLSGYDIKVAQAEHALGELDVKLTADTKDKYGYYSGSDRDAKLQAWEEIEDNYNCTLSIVAYPSDAPWGPSRWAYILTQAQNEAPEYDFYITPNAQIPQYVAGGAILELTDWYNEYGKNCMSDMDIQANSYKNKIYGFICQDVNLPIVMSYNINLLKDIQLQDSTIKEPAQMFLDGEWNYDAFETYCKQVQQAMITKYGQEQNYYCLSGYGTYYWQGMVNAGGVKILDTTSLQVNITGTVESAAAQTMQNIYNAGAMDPAFQVDQGVASWNNQHALFNVGALWFVNSSNRWAIDLWGEGTTDYGYVPFPTPAGLEAEGNYVAVTSDACFVMASGREWAYEGYGSDCTAENIFRAYVDYWTTAKQIYQSSEDYSRVGALTAFANEKFGSEASVQAYIKMILGTYTDEGYVNGIEDYGFYDPFIGSNAVVASWGAGDTFAGSVCSFIKGTGGAQWTDAVGTFEPTIRQSLVDAFG